MRKRIKKIKAISAAKVLGALYALFGLIIAIVIALLDVIAPETIGQSKSALILLAIPLIYGVLGFICGGILAFFYNLVSEYTGGIEIELD